MPSQQGCRLATAGVAAYREDALVGVVKVDALEAFVEPLELGKS